MISLIVGVITLTGCLQDLTLNSEKKKEPDVVNTYVGVYREFRVEIVDTKYGNENWEMFIRMSPTSKDRDYDQILVNAVRKNGRLEFKKVFYCGYPDRTNGCNGLELLGENKFKVIPDERDKGLVIPFTTEMYFFATKKAEESVAEICNAEHLVKSDVKGLGDVVKQ